MILLICGFTFFLLSKNTKTSKNMDDFEWSDHIEEHVQTMIQSHPVTIIYHSHCPHCLMVENLLRQKTNGDYAVFDLIKHEDHDDAEQIRQYLWKTTGRQVVPWVFIDGKFVGDRFAVEKLDSTGELDKMIEKAMKRKDEL